MMKESPPDRRELDTIVGSEVSPADRCEPAAARRPWVGVHFECCRVYARIYRNREGTAYHGRCPRCLREVTLRIGPDGTDARFFSAT